MAMTASLACSPTTVRAGPNGKVACTLTVSNSGAVDVFVTGVKVKIKKNGSDVPRDVAHVGEVNLTPTLAKSPAGGNTKLMFEVVFHHPIVGSNETYDVDCDVFCDDGTSPAVTAVAITVSKVVV